MRPEVIQRLIECNTQFYQTFAAPFAATRQRIQPGVRRILAGLPAGGALLDLGCGNGEAAHELHHQGWQGCYVGVDFSPGLLDISRRLALPERFSFVQADLTSADWPRRLTDSAWSRQAGQLPGHETAATGFAVFHHIPGAARRRQLLQQISRLLKPGSRLILSNWQFLNSPRLAARLQPWERIGLTAQDVEPGDFLLDWRSGGEGLRYIHHFSPDELPTLAASFGFHLRESFNSDGANNQLGLYQIWEYAPLPEC